MEPKVDTFLVILTRKENLTGKHFGVCNREVRNSRERKGGYVGRELEEGDGIRKNLEET